MFQEEQKHHGKTCCVTGHRKFEGAKRAYVERLLYAEIKLAIEEGYTRFISGFAEGADLLFAGIVAACKQKHCITLEAALPYQRRMYSLDPVFQKLLAQCDTVGVHSAAYHPGCFAKRNRFMVVASDRVIAVYDGRKQGGTLNTIKMAREQGKELRLISIPRVV